MDDLEVRIPKEITEYHEKFYGLTLRQILACLAIAAINIPLYMNLSKAIGDDLASYVVILVAGIGGLVLGFGGTTASYKVSISATAVAMILGIVMNLILKDHSMEIEEETEEELEKKNEEIK